MEIRQATVDDLISMQNANLHNLPENYTMKYYLYHALTWPELSYVALNHKQEIVGYILAKMDEDQTDPPAGHVTSISVLRSYRRLGLAAKLMRQSQRAMLRLYSAHHITLHVRESNKAAIALYKGTLGFEETGVEKGYYHDGEAAYKMTYDFKEEKAEL